MEAVSSDLLIEDDHPGLRIQLLELEGVLDGMGAADAAAIGAAFVAGAYALDHYYCLDIGYWVLGIGDLGF